MKNSYFKSIIIFFIIILSNSLIFVSSINALPRWERLSWVEDTSKSISITWNDDIQSEGQAEIKLYEKNEVVSYKAISINTNQKELDYVYSLTITGLKAVTKYQYRVKSDNIWSQWHTFETAPEQFSCDPFKFIIIGDSRGEQCSIPFICDDDHYEESENWMLVSQQMVKESPLFIVHTGDFVFNGDKSEQWEDELNIEGFRTFIKEIPFFLTAGNHDIRTETGNNALFNKLFNFPHNNFQQAHDYYYFIVGNVLIVVLNTTSIPMSEQLDWLTQVLETNKNRVDWKIIAFHVPVWTSGVSHGSNENNKTEAEKLIPILDRYNVDLVFSGHEHIYERFHPMKGYKNGEPQEVNPLHLQGGHKGIANGTIYIVTAGSGAILSQVIRPIKGSVINFSRFHFVFIQVDGGRLRLNIPDLGGRFHASLQNSDLDWIELNKDKIFCNSQEKIEQQNNIQNVIRLEQDKNNDDKLTVITKINETKNDDSKSINNETKINNKNRSEERRKGFIFSCSSYPVNTKLSVDDKLLNIIYCLVILVMVICIRQKNKI